ncbi:SDR family NAD(P)-dependent oxidoreductase [Minwuia thermotolerans]|uniref:3-hydroxyacyl-CoA dehydrogenase n=1 Tax=Minwuia thermotolerans TaxID=2056226 RepID=A0A2M9G3X6_9PROT|nr:SDR family NAD(P)-dependent oxidoreductase [Minwuia thermotolerans]PJK30386.1 3-hydroxyacyl-CoA dehydrogenase [Minwuia thermotolerans]
MSESGKAHVLVTGGAQGVGRAVAERFMAAGHPVTITGRKAEALAKAAGEMGGAVHAIAADVSVEDDVARLFEQAAEAGGPIGVLVNNAGMSGSAPLSRMSVDHFDRMMAANARGVFLCCRAAAKPMADMGGGRIVNIASTAGLKGYAYVAGYVASKHAAVGLTRALALELAGKNITVNAICPGFIETPMTAQTIANIVEKTGRSEEEARAELVKFNPQKRLIETDEIADLALWLAGPGARSVNGQVIAIDGGESA